MAVSYTHLDVYKRQGGMMSRFWSLSLYKGDEGLHAPVKWYEPELNDSDWEEVNMFSYQLGSKDGYPVSYTHLDVYKRQIYGLGILQNGKMSQRNQRKYLMPGNVEDGITFFQSVKGYGLFWDNYSPTNFADDENETSFESEVGDCTDYYFTVSYTHLDVYKRQIRHGTWCLSVSPCTANTYRHDTSPDVFSVYFEMHPVELPFKEK